MGARVAAGLWLLALAVVPAACTAERPAGAEVELVFKHSKLFGDPGPLDRLLRRFEAEQPGLQVRAEPLPSGSDEQHQFYVINLHAGSRDFDVFALDVIWIAEFARAGWLRDLSALLPPAERAAFFPAPLDAATHAGRLWAVPWFVDAGLLYYRRDLLEARGLAPPETWDELVAAARALADGDRLYGYVWQGKQYEGLVCNVLEVLWSHGGRVLAGDRVVLDSPENRRGLGFLHDLVHRHRISPPHVTTATEETARRIFGEGRAVFLRNWPYAWALFQREGSPVRGKVGVGLLPAAPGQTPAAALGGWQLGVNPRSRHPRAAERLVRFLTGAEAQAELVRAYGLYPPRPALYRDPELLAAQPLMAALAPVLARARPRPVSPAYVRISQVLQGEFSAAIAGVKPPAAALEAAQAELERIGRDEERLRSR